MPRRMWFVVMVTPAAGKQLAPLQQLDHTLARGIHYCGGTGARTPAEERHGAGKVHRDGPALDRALRCAAHAPVRPARKHHDARAASIGEGSVCATLESTAAGTARFATARQLYHGCGRFDPQLPDQAIQT